MLIRVLNGGYKRNNGNNHIALSQKIFSSILNTGTRDEKDAQIFDKFISLGTFLLAFVICVEHMDFNGGIVMYHYI